MVSLLRPSFDPLALVGTAATLFVAFSVCQIIYAIFFHPLRKIPGPWWSAVTRIPYAYYNLKGLSHKYLRSLHKRYGPTVRFSPNEVSVTSGNQAWQEIYGFRTGKQKGTLPFQKDAVWYPAPPFNVPHLLVASDSVHSRQRRIISHAFSEKSLRNQEWLIQKYADLMVSRIKDTYAQQGGTADLGRWYTWTTFDVIADLTFGESFHCLESASTQRWVSLLEGGTRAFPKVYCMRYWPFLQRIHQAIFGLPKAIQLRSEFQDYVQEKVLKRIGAETGRNDFMTAILQKLSEERGKGNEGITEAEIVSNAYLFFGAGTETSATALQCATYFVLRDSAVYAKLREEIRSRFKSKDEITIEGTNTLTYLNAVLSEALRMIPPVPAGFPRKVPPGGAVVCDHFLPGDANISVSMSHQASYRDAANFKNPDEFAPERWLGDVRYKEDNRATFSPFSFGPRNCIGKNLAYAEMRIIFAKTIFAFDMELDQGMDDWLERCIVSAVWFKPPCLVKLTPVQ